MLLLEAVNAKAFIARAMRTVNGLENVVDEAWSDYNAMLDHHTELANKAMRTLVNRLPLKIGSERAEIAMTPSVRNRFFKDMAKVYGNWEQSVLGDLDIPRWARGKPSWEKSLGLHPHRGGQFMMQLRAKVLRQINTLAANHVRHTPDEVEEAKKSIPKLKFKFSSKALGKTFVTHKVNGILTRVPLTKGKANPKSLAPSISKLFKKSTPSVIGEQEKAWMENILRGMDGLARGHANTVYDCATSNPTKPQLEQVIQKFSKGEMNKRQLKLSVQTHVRAMVRRVLTSPKMKTDFVLQVPDTRTGVKVGNHAKANAFKIVPTDEYCDSSSGMGDSLGSYPGDTIQPIPVPEGLDLSDAADEARTVFLQGDDE